MSIYLTAFITSKPEKTEIVKTLLQNMVISSRKETACIQYDLHQKANVFIFHEEWESQEGLDLHNTQPYIVDFVKIAPDLVEGNVALYQTERIS